MEICKHDGEKDVGWDEVTCLDCGWVKPSGPARGPNNGWFPSVKAVKDFDAYKFYPGINDTKPTKETSHA
jgi:hypothetical protein